MPTKPSMATLASGFVAFSRTKPRQNKTLVIKRLPL